ncbi:hypothetical protein SAMN04487886_11583 [Clostridium sp. DSM 8431]|uniref:hypothetical protein n=1 Tax=Clostridium sp. DSM 8431 TaxID=1761781 RepID=UPI0008E9B4F2|nr:hypothetical protein [Clostridium sp. DSM 8431]SFU78380.1 hypothetical protein SAMN04487886_11583 [Clostridium sp. DSM 8431]
MDVIKKKLFKEINLGDSFFDSLKEDYPGFEKWFCSKANKEAYVFEEDNGIQGFLYLKEETGENEEGITPKLPEGKILKVGTFKINAHGTKLGERFIKIILDEMFKRDLKKSYVTIFSKHKELIELLGRYGFVHYGTKKSEAGCENVYIKDTENIVNDIFKDYPRVHVDGVNKFMLSIWPKFHTRMFPNSQLKTETSHVVEDLSYTNSIEKIYLSAANLSKYQKGDIVVIYRTAEYGKKAEYSAVATSVCVIEEIKNICEFRSYDEFKKYCIKHSVFSESELNSFWRTKKYKYIINMLYNIALPKRPIRKKLIEEVGLSREARWVAVDLTDDEFFKILELGEINESFIIN